MDYILANAVAEGAGAVKDTGANVMAWVQTLAESLGPIGKYLLALVVFIIGKWVAKAIGKLVTKAMGKTDVDEKLAKMGGFSPMGIEKAIGNLVYLLLLLFVVMLALDFAGLKTAVEPLRDMFTKFMGYIPNLIGGGIVLFLVIFLARIVKGLLANFMGAAQVDQRLGVTQGQPITNSVSNGVFFFIILLLLPMILGVFNLPGITEPVTAMVQQITNAIPGILTGVILFAVGFLIARIVQQLVYNGLNAVGFNTLPSRLGFRGEIAEGAKSPAGAVSYLAMITILVTVATQALGKMNLGIISELGNDFLGGYFNIIGAVIILAIALFASNIAHNALAGRNAALASIVKWAILFFGAAVALQRSGIAPNITGTPFLAIVIALAFALGVGGAIALGLGARNTVARYLERKGL